MMARFKPCLGTFCSVPLVTATSRANPFVFGGNMVYKRQWIETMLPRQLMETFLAFGTILLELVLGATLLFYNSCGALS
jgi:hypothetical protein